MRSEATISHILYMDDIKLYARNEQDINSFFHITRIYSNNIRMPLQLEKFGIKDDEKMITTKGVKLHSNAAMQFRAPTNTLGSCRQMRTMWKTQGSQPQPNNYTVVRRVLKSWLNRKNKV